MTDDKKSNSERLPESDHEGRDQYYMDIDRMVNEGLGGGTVSVHNGLIEETTTDTMESENE
ncbi:hypothetical protein ACFSL6_19340 [Paenibacillus thailandensis]|uniref:DUF4025 domain-containing protein n=1 Tax=Paenibacillus thailandensis TaxID=393250 RepID=A0ABW5QT37_9BACL